LQRHTGDRKGSKPRPKPSRLRKNLDYLRESLAFSDVKVLDVGAELFPIVLRHGENAVCLSQREKRM